MKTSKDVGMKLEGTEMRVPWVFNCPRHYLVAGDSRLSPSISAFLLLFVQAPMCRSLALRVGTDPSLTRGFFRNSLFTNKAL